MLRQFNRLCAYCGMPMGPTDVVEIYCMEICHKQCLKNKLKDPMDTIASELYEKMKGPDKDLSKPQNHEDRHDVSDKVLDTLKEVAYNQDDYGIEKYRKALHHSSQYDWMAMFFEEIADGLKYLQNEMDRRAVIKKYLETAISIKDWQHVQKALDLLNISGTGK